MVPIKWFILELKSKKEIQQQKKAVYGLRCDVCKSFIFFYLAFEIKVLIIYSGWYIFFFHNDCVWTTTSELYITTRTGNLRYRKKNIWIWINTILVRYFFSNVCNSCGPCVVYIIELPIEMFKKFNLIIFMKKIKINF